MVGWQQVLAGEGGWYGVGGGDDGGRGGGWLTTGIWREI